MRSSLRGFTLLEAVIGLSLGIIVAGTAVTVLSMVLVGSRRQRELSELQRDGQFASQLLTQELRQAGLGVPTGGHIEIDAAGTSTFGTTPPANGVSFAERRLLVATATSLLFVGDLPRQDANYPLFGLLDSRPTGSEQVVAFLTENNGSCLPGGCNTVDGSVFFPSSGGGNNCTMGGVTRTCPWALRRVVLSDRVQIVDGQGRWSHAGVSSLNAAQPGTALGMQLTKDMDASPTTKWPSAALGDGPGGVMGQGWVTSLDRVAYVYDNGTQTITRQQCWGDPDPTHANWPPAGAAAMPGGLVVNGSCTPAEVIARHVSAFTFSYVDDTGATITPVTAHAKNTIRRVNWSMTLQVTGLNLGSGPVTYTTTGTVEMKNIQPGEP